MIIYIIKGTIITLSLLKDKDSEYSMIAWKSHLQDL